MGEPVRDDLVGLLGEACACDMSLAWYDDGERHVRDLIGDRKYKRIVEIGTFNGVSACILADYADLVETFDVAIAPQTLRVMEYAKSTGRNIVRYVGDASGCFAEYKAACEGAELVFVDADHWGDRPTRDVIAAIDGGAQRILVHDATDHFPAVQEAISCAEANGYTITRKGELALCERPND